MLVFSSFTPFLKLNIRAKETRDIALADLTILNEDSKIYFMNADQEVCNHKLSNLSDLSDLKCTKNRVKKSDNKIAEYKYVNLELNYTFEPSLSLSKVDADVAIIDESTKTNISTLTTQKVSVIDNKISFSINNIDFSTIADSINTIQIQTVISGEDNSCAYEGQINHPITFAEGLTEDEKPGEDVTEENDDIPNTPPYVQSELRRSSGSPQIKFKDASGKTIKLNNGDEWLILGDKDLIFNSTSFTYKNSETYNYKNVDLYFSYTDYSCNLPKKKIALFSDEEDIFGTIINKDMVAELELGGNILEADIIECVRSSKNNPEFKIYYKNVDCFSDFDNQAQLYVRYQIQTGDDISDEIYKGSIDYEFTNLEVIDKNAKNEEITVNLVQPEKNQTTTSSKTSETNIKTTTPFILINNSTLQNGKNFVTAGEKFSINISFANTHKKQDLENVLLQIDVPSEFILENSSNTFLIGDIENGKALSKTLSFSVNPTADVKNYAIPIIFSYEYVDDGSRKEDKLTQEIVIPVKQNIRFDAAKLDFMPNYETGRDVTINSAYANLSKTKIYNVKAVLETEIFSNQKVIYIGNLNAGEGGSVKFTVQALEEGKKALKITYFYENESGNQFKYETSGEMNFVLPPVIEETEEKEIIVVPSENPQPTVTYIEKTPEENQNKLNSSEVVIIALGMALLGGLFVYAKMSNKIKPHK